jgi:hypothetical protein
MARRSTSLPFSSERVQLTSVSIDMRLSLGSTASIWIGGSVMRTVESSTSEIIAGVSRRASMP